MPRDKEDFEGKLGFDRKTAAEMLQRFLGTKEEIRKHIHDLRATQNGYMNSSERTELAHSISELEQDKEAVEQQILTVRDWYGLWVLEGLEKESRRVNQLTIVLSILTGFLALFTALLWSGIRP